MRHGAICKRRCRRSAISIHGPLKRKSPASLVLATSTRGDVILCQITSQAAGHPEAVPILATDFEPGGVLRQASFALPHRLATANEIIIRRVAGRLKADKLNHLRERVCAVIRQQ